MLTSPTSALSLNLMLWIGCLIFFIGIFVLTAFSSALRRLQRKGGLIELTQIGKIFFYRPLHLSFFPDQEYEGIIFATLMTLNNCRLLLAFCLSGLLFTHYTNSPPSIYLNLFYGLLGLTLFFIVADYIPRILGSLNPKALFRFMAPFASLYLILAFPFNYVFMKLSIVMFKSVTFEDLQEPMAEARQELYDIIQDSVQDKMLDPHDKKLIQSVFSFRDLIAREVMMPRVDVFSLPFDLSVKESALKLEQEGYSRIPVYKGNIDHIIGVLMYKDVLAKFREATEKQDPKIIDQSIESILKPVIYTPETKKISHLLQEFRKRQVHMAIVVDEYGGTEGIVTIEDILEEIVGDIEDEYDDEEDLFIEMPDESYVVDARMNIFDLEEQLNISLPEAGDYDTLGGYVFHKAGEIPTRGFIIKLDDVTLEVLRASERSVEKVKIKRNTPS